MGKSGDLMLEGTLQKFFIAEVRKIEKQFDNFLEILAKMFFFFFNLSILDFY